MFRWIVGSSLKYRFIVLALAAALILVGVDQMRDMRVDVFPEFAPPIVEIQTPCLGLSPTEVEALVTIPLEQALAGLPELDILRSKSVTDLSSVKQRPALVVSADTWNAAQPDVVPVAVPSQIPVELGSGEILLRPADQQAGG